VEGKIIRNDRWKFEILRILVGWMGKYDGKFYFNYFIAFLIKL
jgi:hypothetical protein